MFIKRIVHFFTSRRLEAHQLETEAKLKEMGRRKRELQDRLEHEAQRYEREIRDLVARREASLKQLAALLESHAVDTTAYASLLAELQTLMLACVEAWSAKSQIESALSLKGERIQGLKSEQALLHEMDADIRRLSQLEERGQWQACIQDRPCRVDTPQVREHERRAGMEVANDGSDVKHELRRLRGHARSVALELRTVRAEHAKLREVDLPAAREQLRERRAAVLSQFNRCRAAWTALQEALDAAHADFTTESPLARQWLAEADDGHSYRGLQQVLGEARERSEALDASRAALTTRMADLKSRIATVHQEQRYEALDELKFQRGEVFERIKRVGAESFQVRQAIRELRVRRDKLRDLRSLMDPLHPAKTVEQVFDRIGKDDPDLYWKSIGLSTKALPRPAKDPVKEEA